MSHGSYCFVKTCNTNKLDNPSISFMRLPKDPSLARKWVEFADRTEILKDELYKKKAYLICSKHFLEKDFKSLHSKRRLLWPKTIPSLNGPKQNNTTEYTQPTIKRKAVEYTNIEKASSSICKGVTKSSRNVCNENNTTDTQPTIKRKAVKYTSIEKTRSSSVCKDVTESSHNVCNDNNTTDLQPSIKRKAVECTSTKKAQSSSICKDVTESSHNVCNDNSTIDLKSNIEREAGIEKARSSICKDVTESNHNVSNEAQKSFISEAIIKMEENDDSNEGSNNNGKTKERKLPFGSQENMVTILNALFKHGYQNLPNIIPGMSMDECQSKMNSALKLTETFLKNKPSIVDWLRSTLFEKYECNVPLALLFIALFEQHPLPYQEDTECDFKEVYHFLYKMTTNQPASQLSPNSAIVLHKLLSEIIEEVWPSTQLDLLKYLSKIHIYSRSPVRRTYSRKKNDAG